MDCKNCKHFHKGLRREFEELAKNIIGECDNINVPFRICVSEGMICYGKFFEALNHIKETS